MIAVDDFYRSNVNSRRVSPVPDHNVARQNPADYIKGIEVTIKEVVNR